MNARQTSRSGAALLALTVQAVLVLMFWFAFSAKPKSTPESPSIGVVLVPELHPDFDRTANLPRANLRQIDAGRPPPLPEVDITLPTPPTPQDTTPATRTTDNASSGDNGTDSHLQKIYAPDPEYPRSAVERVSQGTTELQVLVNADGLPDIVKVTHSSGDPELDAAAVHGVQKWEFIAATSHSKAVARWGQVTVNFDLKVFLSTHHGKSAKGSKTEYDPVDRLDELIKSWGLDPDGHPHRQDSHGAGPLNPAVVQILHKSGGVRHIRFLGAASRLPDEAAAGASEQLRLLDPNTLTGWNEFEVTQEMGTSLWYCAVDDAGHIQGIVVSGS